MTSSTNALNGQFNHNNDNSTNISDPARHYPSLNGLGEPDQVDIYVTFLRRGETIEDAHFIRNNLTEQGLYQTAEYSYLRNQIDSVFDPVPSLWTRLLG